MNKTPDNNFVSQQMLEVKQHDEAAIAALWEQYYPALARLAEKRLTATGVRQRAFNGEELAASALVNFFRAVQRNRFPGLDSEDGLRS